MHPPDPWEDLKYALETDHADLVLRAIRALMRIGESPEDIKKWVDKNVHPEKDW